jgi:hypothetical protein
MVHREDMLGSSEDWNRAEYDVPQYSAEDSAAPTTTAAALNIRYGRRGFEMYQQEFDMTC